MSACVVFVGGGARSGKSQHAEALARALQRQRGGRRWYLATARATDDEMVARIARHQSARGAGWTTLEVPSALADALDTVETGATVLIDCLTVWAAHWLFEDGGDEHAGAAMLDSALARARARRLALIVVSNDLNEDLPPTDPLTWRYLRFLQSLHCRLASAADAVIEVVGGVPMEWKPLSDRGDAGWLS